MQTHPSKIQGKWKIQIDTIKKKLKKKSKQLTKIKYKPYAKKNHGYEMAINNKKISIKQKSFLLSQIS
jgi:hypothetical protein